MYTDVLVIEDDAATRDALAEVLEDVGFSVRTAEHGLEGIRSLHEARPRVVLMDLVMPVMNGWRTLECIRANPAFRVLPVVTMSASFAAQEPDGCQGMLPKPITKEALLRALFPWLGEPSSGPTAAL